MNHPAVTDPRHFARFNTDHSMIFIIAKIRHPFRLIDPRIPNHRGITAVFVDVDHPLISRIHDPYTAATAEHTVDLTVDFQRTILYTILIDHRIKERYSMQTLNGNFFRITDVEVGMQRSAEMESATPRLFTSNESVRV